MSFKIAQIANSYTVTHFGYEINNTDLLLLSFINGLKLDKTVMNQDSNFEPPAKEELPDSQGQLHKDGNLTVVISTQYGELSKPARCPVKEESPTDDSQSTGTIKNIEPDVTEQDFFDHPLSSISSHFNCMNSTEGILYIMNSQEKPPSTFGKRMLYKVPLLFFYFIDFIYQIVAWAVKRNYHAYYLITIAISLTGLISVICIVYISTLYTMRQKENKNNEEVENKDKEEDENKDKEEDENKNKVEVENKDKEEDENKDKEEDENKDKEEDENKDKEENENKDKEEDEEDNTIFQILKHLHLCLQTIPNPTNALKNYLLHSVDEILIFPSLICHLYGIINEKSWESDNGIAVFNFIMFIFIILMDLIYAKFYFEYLMVNIITISYSKYYTFKCEKILHKAKVWKNFLYVIVPLTAMTMFIQYVMFAITGVQIYDDNFSVGTNTSENATGSYKMSGFAFLMIFSSAYLPTASWITFIIVNKYWFYEIYSNIKQSSHDQEVHLQFISPWVKFVAFFVDPAAYVVSSIFLMPVFIFFIVAMFTLLANSEEANEVSIALAVLFITTFLLTNFQAVIAAGIIYTVITIMIILLLMIYLIGILVVPVILIVILLYKWYKGINFF